jgi:hypothetical protein
MARTSRTAFFGAAKKWDFVAVKALLEAEPDLIEATDAKGLNGLHVACAVKPGGAGLREPNGLKTVRVILDAGIEINAIAFGDDGGEWRANAVWFAAGRGQNLPLVKLLLKRGGDAGADPWIQDHAGVTPLDLARKRKVPKEFVERMERMRS